MGTLNLIGALFAALVPTSAVTLWILKLVINKELAKFRTELCESLDKQFMSSSQLKGDEDYGGGEVSHPRTHPHGVQDDDELQDDGIFVSRLLLIGVCRKKTNSLWCWRLVAAGCCPARTKQIE